MTLAQRFDPRHNSLNALRLVLAVAVIVSHAWPLGGYGDDPGWGGQNLGDWAVAGFFALSGFLIVGSRLHSDLRGYFVRRFLRIYPAFVVCMVLIAFVVAPLSTVLDGTGDYSLASGVDFVVRNLGLLIMQWGIDGTLTDVPFDGAWNGPTWTLFYEFLCYIWIALIVTIVPRRWLAVAVGVILAVSTAATLRVLVLDLDSATRSAQLMRLSTYFAAGSLVYLLKNRLPSSRRLAVCAVVLVLLTMGLGVFQAFAALPLAYLLIFVGSGTRFAAVGARNDISYGMYIWAFPMQQLLAIVLGGDVPVAVFVLLSVALTVPPAWASWLVVERHAMRVKSLVAAR